MTFTFNNAPVSALNLTIPKIGNITARVVTTTDVDAPIGSRASLILEDLSIICTPIRGRNHLSRGNYLVVGGAGAWRLYVPSDPTTGARGGLRSDAGIKLSTAANALAAAVNVAATRAGLAGRESVTVSNDRVLGPAHVRLGMTGAACLDTLGAWYMRPDGVTVIGTRPTGASSAKIVVGPFDPSCNKLIVSLPQGDVAALVNSIGSTITGPTIEGEIIFESLEITIADGKIRYTVNP
jgi:hypothetical protein